MGIPIVCVIDTDKQPARFVIDGYLEAGYDFLFAEQVINYSTAYRSQALALILEAIERATSKYHKSSSTLIPKKAKIASIVHAEVADGNAHGFILLKKALLSKYGSLQEAFDAFSNAEGHFGKKEVKKLIRRMKLKKLKKLVKMFPTQILSVDDFCRTIEGSSTTQDDGSDSTKTEPFGLAKLPLEGTVRVFVLICHESHFL